MGQTDAGNAGFTGDIYFIGGTGLLDNNAYVWVKPIDELKLDFGKRGYDGNEKIGAILTFFDQTGLADKVLGDDTIFSRTQTGLTGFLAEFEKGQVAVQFGVADAVKNINYTSSDPWNTVVATGSFTTDAFAVRLGYFGQGDKGGFGLNSSASGHYFGAVEVAAAITAIPGSLIDIGFKQGLDYTKDAKDTTDTQIAAGFKGKFGALGLNLGVTALLGGKADVSDYFDLGIGLSPYYAISESFTIGLDASVETTSKANSTTGTKKDTTFAVDLGIYGAIGAFYFGLIVDDLVTSQSNAGTAVDKSTVPMKLYIPLVLTVAF
jgi:hypothetical protein